MRFSLAATAGLGMDGSHASTTGIDGDGGLIAVPRHHHDTALTFTRIELAVSVDVAMRWQVRARLPFDLYRQRSRVLLDEPATEEEQAAMWRNHDIHHANATYMGLADAALLGARRVTSLFRNDDSLAFAFGFTLPIGRTEPDPYELGARGLPHRHIQFGNGTIDPLFEFAYTLRVLPELATAFSAAGRFPIYPNDKDYRGSIESTLALTVRYLFAAEIDVPLALHVSYVMLLEGYARWRGERDVNSGLLAHLIFMGGRYEAAETFALEFEVGLPLAQRPLAVAQTFAQNVMLRLNVTSLF